MSLEALVERDGAESSLGVGPGTLRIPQFVDDAVGAMKGMGEYRVSHITFWYRFNVPQTCLLKVSSARMATFGG